MDMNITNKAIDKINNKLQDSNECILTFKNGKYCKIIKSVGRKGNYCGSWYDLYFEDEQKCFKANLITLANKVLELGWNNQ